jgi:hypothetical protein
MLRVGPSLLNELRLFLLGSLLGLLLLSALLCLFLLRTLLFGQLLSMLRLFLLGALLPPTKKSQLAHRQDTKASGARVQRSIAHRSELTPTSTVTSTQAPGVPF